MGSTDVSREILFVPVDPHGVGTAGQLEITVQTYKTSVKFDLARLQEGAESAWLADKDFGVVAKVPSVRPDCLHIVLGYKGEKRIRVFDTAEHRLHNAIYPNAIVETMGVRYVSDDEGYVRFTTFGGGQRFTEALLAGFNFQYMGFPLQAAEPLHFDLDRVRDLCFGEYVERLYRVGFSVNSAEYETIDHAEFRSREFIDPSTPRLAEPRDDPTTVVESFEAQAEVAGDRLKTPAKVRFTVNGIKGALRLRLPKLDYNTSPRTLEDQDRTFYAVVDEVVSKIAGDSLYSPTPLTLEEIQRFDGWAEMAPLDRYKLALRDRGQRERFFEDVDLSSQDKSTWLPHLRALSQLVAENPSFEEHVATCLEDLAIRSPSQVVMILQFCVDRMDVPELGLLAADALSARLPRLPADALRGDAEDSLVQWAAARETDSWDVDPSANTIAVRNLRFTIGELAPDALPVLLQKVILVVHSRLERAARTDDLVELLTKFNWCVNAAQAVSPNHPRSSSGVRILGAKRVPKNVRDGDRILTRPIATIEELDRDMLAQHALPLWPCLRAFRDNNGIELVNEGIGAALSLAVFDTHTAGKPLVQELDLLAGERVRIQAPAGMKSLAATFSKFGATRSTLLRIHDSAPETTPGRVVQLVIGRQRKSALLKYRDAIDPRGAVVGGNPQILQMFEEIHYANLRRPGESFLPAVLLLGERGVGKTHVAQLLHDSSNRSKVKDGFHTVEASGTGGDVNIQRAEWLGYGKNAGGNNLNARGRPGHLMEANGGTLFVDEFGELSRELQEIFRPILEHRPIPRQGGDLINPDVRLIFGTNVDVQKAAEDGKLKDDLLDRVPVKITIPPLRARRGDILALAAHFLKPAAKADDGEQKADQSEDFSLDGDRPAKGRRPVPKDGDSSVGTKSTYPILSPGAKLALLLYDWPGNVRELRDAIGAAFIRVADGSKRITVDHLVNLPASIRDRVRDRSDDDCNQELLRRAEEIAREEGLGGAQWRITEIMGISKGWTSKLVKSDQQAVAASSR